MCKYPSAIAAVAISISVLLISAIGAPTESLLKSSPQTVGVDSSIGESEKPSFEVISIKRIPSDSPQFNRSAYEFLPGGRFRALGNLHGLISSAYEVPYLRVLVEEQFWIDEARWNIEAKPEESKYPLKNGKLDPHLGNLMAQSMLEDRFKIKTHRETKILSGYELTTAKGGPKLKAPKPPLRLNSKPGEKPPAGGFGIMNGDGRISLFNGNLSMLATILSQQLNCAVVDKTGITGSYGIDIVWTPNSVRASIAAPGSTISDDPEITIFDAIQEQVGLKLVPARIPTPVLVIDDAQMPKLD